MRIKKLEIKGFKSFCNRTLLDFTSGITAIVGPNGCGKSNIVDAIRWVLGEQSAKDLRGRVMEDVIFSGTEREKPVGLAEVDLTFSNENGDAPEAFAHFTEIMITRRLYRSGESEYLTNGVSCRRRDIIEFFMGTGLGKNAYSIVEQGRVESLINARPGERRAFIEEASGISRYRSQREAALRRMETTQASLLRVSDIENELKRQINALKRQARKTKLYKKIRQEIRQIEMGSLVAQYKAGCREIASLEEQLQTVRNQEVSLSNALQTEEVILEEARLRILEGERETASIQQQTYDISVQIEKIDNRFSMIDRRLKDLKDTHERQGAELEESVRRLEQDDITAEELRREAKETEDLMLQCRRDLEKFLSQYESHKREMCLLEEELEQIKIERARVEASHVRLEAEWTTGYRRLTEEKEHLEPLAQEMIHLRKEMAEVSQNLDDVTLRIEKGVEVKRRLKERYEQSTEHLEGVLSRYSQISENLDSVRQEVSGKASRLQSLKELEDRFEWFDGGVQEIMRRWKPSQSGNGVHGLVADIFHTEPQFEAALEAALAQMLQSIIIENPHEGVGAIEHLKSRSAGRVCFVPLHPRNKDNDQAFSQIKGNGILGPLMEHVELADPYKSLGRALLSDFVLVKDLPTAMAIWEGQGPMPPMVTLDGEVVTPMGAIWGGISGDGGKGILHRKRDIRELSQEVEALRSSCTAIQQELVVIERQRVEAVQSVECCRDELQREEIGLATAMKDRAAFQDIYGRLTERQQRVSQQQEISRAVIEGLMSEIDEKAKEAKITASRLEDLNIRMEKGSAVVQERRSMVEHLGAEVTRLKVALSAMEQRSQHVQENLVRLEAIRNEGTRKVEKLEEAQKTALSEMSEMVETRGRLEREKDTLVGRQLVIQEELESRRDQLRRDSQELEQREDTCKRLRKELNDLTSQRASQLNLEISKVQINLQHLEERAEERHAVALSQIATNFDTDGINPENARVRLEQLRAELEKIGEVNLLADSELDELQQRHDHLSGQRADLAQAMDDLEKTITRIDRETRQRFMATFQEANRRFGEIFPVLFSGGKGELILTGNGDPLEAGVDLVVQPPGKKLQSISLLSGGEKTLAAVALIFSLFLIKPSPLCLLDEVDASLDDVNIDRFVSLLQKYRGQFQFILVTHNKRTMAIADTLYGVTMEEPGISKLVSVRLNGGKQPGHNGGPKREEPAGRDTVRKEELLQL
ncbi:MAG: chromosome segregation protein SMC [Deltaproteobacteria bacterium]|nr:chromosome segregation protein SMC [Deltaproteobacteria bacterium]